MSCRTLALAAALTVGCSHPAPPCSPQPSVVVHAEDAAPPPQAEHAVAPMANAAPAQPPRSPLPPDSTTFGPSQTDLSSLAQFDYPPALRVADAPAALPKGDNPLQRVKGELRDNGYARPSRLSVGSKLVRLQIGTVRISGFASNSKALRCGDDPKSTAKAKPSLGGRPPVPFPPSRELKGISPARWEVLTREGDELVLTITDAWFDPQDCTASVQRVTTVKPTPVLNDLVYAFRGQCPDCKQTDVVTFVTPSLNMSSRRAWNTSGGPFTLLRREHKARYGYRFNGTVDDFAHDTWLGRPRRSNPPGTSGVTLLHVRLEWRLKEAHHVVSAFGASAPANAHLP